jgi:hypothetical protein
MFISFDDLSEGVRQDFLAWVNRKFEPYPSFEKLGTDTQDYYLQLYIRECKGVLVASGAITKTGWECPKCGIGVSPLSMVCPECMKRKETKTSSTGFPFNDDVTTQTAGTPTEIKE